MLKPYEERQKRRRAFAEAKMLVKEGRRGLRKFGDQLATDHRQDVKAANDRLEEVLRRRDYAQLPMALEDCR